MNSPFNNYTCRGQVKTKSK